MITPEIIEEVKKRLIEVYDPLTIYLFGSYAWGTPTEDSDLDLLVIIKDSTEKPQARPYAGMKALWGLNISKDLLIYTQEEFDSRTSDYTTLPYVVKKSGKVIYARD
ncbi:nucleotidyltransferase domain-containing protein [Candidatus Babeliales bacterium]|nr:nucleotidyltransferase domain-containing protein [Candidatus Babeliales bacterium]